MQTKKMRPSQSAPFKILRRHCTTALGFVVAVAAWACAMTYLQAESVTQRQQGRPVADVQEVANHE